MGLHTSPLYGYVDKLCFYLLFICIKAVADTTICNFTVEIQKILIFISVIKLLRLQHISMMKVLIVGFILLALGLVSAVPQWPIRQYIPPGFSTTGKELNDETAKSQVFPLALVPMLLSAAPQVISTALDLLRMVVCDNTDSQLQAFADIEEQNVKIMALVRVMSDLLAAEEKLNEVKQLNMKGNLVAEAELFDFNSVASKLKNTLKTIGSAAKKLLCNSSSATH